VFAINALAPFVINSKLIPVLKDGASNERRRFVINVSAMEGKFYRHKQPTHPHTC
jgi:NAD(P)-dependent dehydrogenase (short-subunit alcohol dehydrogenase family)